MNGSSSSNNHYRNSSGGDTAATERSSIGTPSSTMNPKSATTTSTPPDRRNSTTTIDLESQRHQDRRVCHIRLAMITTLLTSTTIVAAFTGIYVGNDERSNFQLQYNDSVAKVAGAFQNRINTKYEVANTFSAMITSRYGNVAQLAVGRDPLWPNVTIPDFQEQTAGSLAIADGRAISFNPIITQGENRLEWEEYATNSAWILGSKRLIEPLPNTTWPENRTVSFGIYSRNSEGEVIYNPTYHPSSVNYSNVMVPVWQIAPIKGNEPAVMFNLHSEPKRQEALDHMMAEKVATLTDLLQLVQDGSETRPSSILFYPVFDVFGKVDTEENEDEEVGKDTSEMDQSKNTHGGRQQNVEASVSIVFSWDTLLNRILPDYIKGMVCVLQSSTGQSFSYSISGDTVTLLGEGDHHDTKYDEYRRRVNAKLLVDEEGNEFITYSLDLYPSEEFQAQYVTNRAGIYAAGAVLIFLFTAGMFVLYDYLVEDRQKRTARLARQTGNIVDGMFPAAFRERLYKIHGDGIPRLRRRSSSSSSDDSGNVGSRRRSSTGTGSGGSGGSDARRRPSNTSGNSGSAGASSSTSTRSNGGGANDDTTRGSMPALKRSLKIGQRSSISGVLGGKKQIDKFMKGLRHDARNVHSNPLLKRSEGGVDDEPIADLFNDTSIMFSDLVGFTKWSSNRSPHEVFRLLEHIFWEFDDIAARHNVFKLGTIGDCYIAVTGIPEPIVDHAIVLTQFAFDARDKVREVFARLDSEGMDTARLDMRFGIHSGDTIAGILRGTKSRFELFGDTINTASRMESTGMGGKIQVSEATAELIRRDYKSRWLTKRDTLVTAKGKGELQTYWVEPERAGYRVSFSEDIIDSKFLADINKCSCDNNLRRGSKGSRRSSGTGSDRFYQHEYGSSSSCGQLSQWDEEKVEEDDQFGSSTHVNDDVEIARDVSLDEDNDQFYEGSPIINVSAEVRELGATVDAELARIFLSDENDEYDDHFDSRALNADESAEVEEVYADDDVEMGKAIASAESEDMLRILDEVDQFDSSTPNDNESAEVNELNANDDIGMARAVSPDEHEVKLDKDDEIVSSALDGNAAEAKHLSADEDTLDDADQFDNSTLEFITAAALNVNDDIEMARGVISGENEGTLDGADRLKSSEAKVLNENADVEMGRVGSLDDNV